MRAIAVSVDYGDFLALTLPANAHYFDSVLVVTASRDTETQDVVAGVPNADCFLTDAFYRDGAKFWKALAVEEGLDYMGRDGQLAIMDADILLPDDIDFNKLKPGYLYSPYRRLCIHQGDYHDGMDWSTLRLGWETWNGEFAGMFQAFWADDPVLDSRPWYDLDWTTAQGCDTTFYQRWPRERRIRPSWEVLHLGPLRTNWCGRKTPKWRNQET